MFFRNICGLALLSGVAAASLSQRESFSVVDDDVVLNDLIFFLVLPPRFERVPTSAVKPSGWALDQAQIQADGLAGHLRDFDS